MIDLPTVLFAALPIFFFVGAGLAMRRLNWLTEEADGSLMRVTVNLLVPCLSFDKILGNGALEHSSNLWLAPLVGFGTVAAGVALAWMVRGFTGLRDEAGRRTFAFSTAIYNYGYVPIPLALALFNDDGQTAGLILVHNLGVELALWTFGMILLGGVNLRTGWKKILSPPVVAILVSVTLNVALRAAHIEVPEVVRSTVRMLGQCAIPMGVILIGATMSDHLHEFGAARGGRVMGLACLLRMGLLPVLFLLLARWLPCSVELKRVIVLQAAMPAAVFPIVMAKHYGGDPATAVRVVVATSLVGLVTIPLWIRFGMHFVGL